MKITIENATVYRDGEEVGTVGPDQEFHPIEGLHHKSAKKIAGEVENLLRGGQEESHLAHTQEIAGSNPAPATITKADVEKVQALDEPAQHPHMGDKTPAYIEWFRQNHTEEEFQAKYGNRKFQDQ